MVTQGEVGFKKYSSRTIKMFEHLSYKKKQVIPNSILENGQSTVNHLDLRLQDL